MKTIKSYEVVTNQNTDVGNVYVVTCPKCNDKVDVSQFSRRSDTKKCRCGYEWQVVLIAYGDKDDRSK